MKAKFINTVLNDSILIIPEGEEEAENLRRWNNCVLTAKYNYAVGRDSDSPALLVVKEI